MLPSRIGITGVAGFIGSHLSDRLLAEGCAIVGVDDFSTGSVDNLEASLAHPSFELHEFDCCDAEAVQRVFASCGAIVHLAAEKIPRYGGALRTLELNVRGTRAVYEAALVNRAHVVVASTSDVYGNAEPPFTEDGNIVLGPPTTRRWAYATSKLYDEHLGLALAEEEGLRVTLLRLFGSFGPRNHPTWRGGPQAAFIERMLDGEAIELHGDGQQVRTFTYVADTVEGFVRALQTRAAEGELFNIGGNRPTTIAELAQLVHDAMGLEAPLDARLVPYEALGGRYQDVLMRIPDTTKAERVLGFRAQTSLEDGLRETVAWHSARRQPVAGQAKTVRSAPRVLRRAIPEPV